MDKKTIILLASAALLASCGRSRQKPDTDTLVAVETVALADTVAQPVDTMLYEAVWNNLSHRFATPETARSIDRLAARQIEMAALMKQLQAIGADERFENLSRKIEPLAYGPDTGEPHPDIAPLLSRLRSEIDDALTLASGSWVSPLAEAATQLAVAEKTATCETASMAIDCLNHTRQAYSHYKDGLLKLATAEADARRLLTAAFK